MYLLCIMFVWPPHAETGNKKFETNKRGAPVGRGTIPKAPRLYLYESNVIKSCPWILSVTFCVVVFAQIVMLLFDVLVLLVVR
jgi:hypothetical protein